MLGYDALDREIVRKIGSRGTTIATLVKKTGMSRSTIDFRLKRLKRNAEVECRRDGSYGYRWYVSTTSKETRSPITIYRGKDMLRAYALLKRLPKKTIMHTLEGYDYFRRSMHTLPHPLISDIQRSYRRRGVTIKSLLHQKYIDHLTTAEPALIHLHRKRSVATAIRRLHRSFLGSGLHVVTPSLYMVFSEKKKYAIVMRDPDVAGMLYESMRELYNMLQYADDLEPFDFNQHIERLTFAKGNTIQPVQKKTSRI